jgi:PIN domain nuclease of toxin-antitoxin system
MLKRADEENSGRLIVQPFPHGCRPGVKDRIRFESSGQQCVGQRFRGLFGTILDQIAAQPHVQPARRFTVPSICLVELTYLVEKGTLPSVARERLIAAPDDPDTACRLAPLDRAVADALEFIDRGTVPDLPDRVETATAIALQVPLISRDGKIQTSIVQTIW